MFAPDEIEAITMTDLKSRRSRAGVALATILMLVAGVAEARPGGGGSFGSRGSRTFDSAPATRTAPNATAPMQRTQTPQTAPNMQRPGAPAPAAQGSRWGGFAGGMLAGVLGAGLIGALMGHGFGGLAGIFSFLMQALLIGGLIWLALRFFRRRQDPALAGAGANGGIARSALGGGMPPAGGGLGSGVGAGLGAGLGGLGRSGPAPQSAGARRDEVGIDEADYGAFERTLVEVQSADSREDVAALWNLATPEMAGYFQEELNENARRGVLNKVSDVRLLQGDLAEAWREGPTDYASVAMRYSLTDVTIDKATGRVVAGDPQPSEAVEVWTFRRDRGGPWKVSAIQQTA